jgi:hypothetical protein
MEGLKMRKQNGLPDKNLRKVSSGNRRRPKMVIRDERGQRQKDGLKISDMTRLASWGTC